VLRRKMLIVGFDCAVKNFGICYIEYNEKHKQELVEYSKKFNDAIAMLRSMPSLTSQENPATSTNDPPTQKNAAQKVVSHYEDTTNGNMSQTMHAVLCLLKEFNVWLSNIYKLVHYEVANIDGANMNERTVNLHAMLTRLDATYKPDLVLIEQQMKHNDISRAISNQILYHYIAKKTEARLVGTGLKNSVSFSTQCTYGKFIQKYSNYVANKKHTEHNFKHYISVMHKDKVEEISKIKKLNDISDAMMMCIGYITAKM
jgi:hypothetical protein